MKHTIEEYLLHASLLCGLSPTSNPAYRLQLFFICNKELGLKSHQSDFQRALESGVDKSKLWENYAEKGSGEYIFSEIGYNRAIKIFGNVKPIYPPTRAKDYNILITGKLNNLMIEIATIGNSKKSTSININNQRIKSAKEACQIIERSTNFLLSTKGESAVRVLYNFSIDHNFELVWKGKKY